jgi:peptidyl-prolyl cis-trans isomerase C
MARRTEGDLMTPEDAAQPSTIESIRALLCARAAELGLLPAGESDAAAEEAAIERLLDQEVVTPEPTEEECGRYYAAHLDRFSSGDLVFARHILFAVTPGAPLEAIRNKAEQTLALVRAQPERFAELATQWSNCPSAAQGGNLGQLQRSDVVPEFAAALFEARREGLLPVLLRTRFGFHIVMIDKRLPGQAVPFDAVRDRIAAHLAQQVQARALRQYVEVLAGRAGARIAGVTAAATPLVQ